MTAETKPYTPDDLARARQEAEQRPHGDAHKWARLRLVRGGMQPCGPRAAPAPITCQKRQARRAALYAATGQHQIFEPSPAGARLMLRRRVGGSPRSPQIPAVRCVDRQNPAICGVLFLWGSLSIQLEEVRLSAFEYRAKSPHIPGSSS
jgi:hypothetical protein